ncbi:MAG: hypothetical protein WDM81_03075 [Rhizomicrobium sp.]
MGEVARTIQTILSAGATGRDATTRVRPLLRQLHHRQGRAGQ